MGMRSGRQRSACQQNQGQHPGLACSCKGRVDVFVSSGHRTKKDPHPGFEGPLIGSWLVGGLQRTAAINDHRHSAGESLEGWVGCPGWKPHTRPCDCNLQSDRPGSTLTCTRTMVLTWSTTCACFKQQACSTRGLILDGPPLEAPPPQATLRDSPRSGEGPMCLSPPHNLPTLPPSQPSTSCGPAGNGRGMLGGGVRLQTTCT